VRLTPYEIEAIKEAFIETFGGGKIYLFGSRVDDTKRGGDIDLYIIPSSRDALTSKKIEFLVALKQKIGEQKIDVVIDRGGDNPIYLAGRKGIEL
jgi:predicted nucleotidyltransferase